MLSTTRPARKVEQPTHHLPATMKKTWTYPEATFKDASFSGITPTVQ